MKLVNTAVNLGAIAVCLGMILALQMPRLNQRISGQTPEADRQWVEREKTRLQFIQQIPPGGFGFNNLISNSTFLAFLQYFGDDKARIDNKTGYALSPKYFEIIVSRDPRFVHGYVYLSASVSIFAGQPQQAVDLMSRGLKSLDPQYQPYAYTVWRRQAVDRLLFLGDIEGARQSFLKAAEWVERAKFDGTEILPEVKYVALASRQSAAFLKNKRDVKKARIAAWGLVLSSAVDRKTTQIAIDELNRLGIEVRFAEDGKVHFVPISPSQK